MAVTDLHLSVGRLWFPSLAPAHSAICASLVRSSSIWLVLPHYALFFFIPIRSFSVQFVLLRSLPLRSALRSSLFLRCSSFSSIHSIPFHSIHSSFSLHLRSSVRFHSHPFQFSCSFSFQMHFDLFLLILDLFSHSLHFVFFRIFFPLLLVPLSQIHFNFLQLKWQIEHT